eukprot:822728_1
MFFRLCLRSRRSFPRSPHRLTYSRWSCSSEAYQSTDSATNYSLPSAGTFAASTSVVSREHVPALVAARMHALSGAERTLSESKRTNGHLEVAGPLVRNEFEALMALAAEHNLDTLWMEVFWTHCNSSVAPCVSRKAYVRALALCFAHSQLAGATRILNKLRDTRPSDKVGEDGVDPAPAATPKSLTAAVAEALLKAVEMKGEGISANFLGIFEELEKNAA